MPATRLRATLPESPPHESVGPEDEDLRVYGRAHEFARSKIGLGLPAWRAEDFATECQENWSLEQLTDFVTFFEFANAHMKLSDKIASK